jgi:diaminohydroxyphosphoribosylaminopyrimidine deaminase / 5-amino-6-(5-phosphoribosylamino)uracil reductase
LLRARLVDRLIWVHAPLLLGGDGIAAIGEFGIEALAGAPRFERLSAQSVGDDVLTLLRVPES